MGFNADIAVATLLGTVMLVVFGLREITTAIRARRRKRCSPQADASPCRPSYREQPSFGSRAGRVAPLVPVGNAMTNVATPAVLVLSSVAGAALVGVANATGHLPESWCLWHSVLLVPGAIGVGLFGLMIVVRFWNDCRWWGRALAYLAAVGLTLVSSLGRWIFPI